MRKVLLSAAAITAAGSAGLIGLSTANAGSLSDNLADRIAAEYNLDADEVREFLGTIREERKAERETERQEHLQGLVDEGVITEEQLTLLQEQVEELKSLRQELKDQDLDRDEIREQLSEAREEFEAWAEENGINLDEIKPDRDHGRRGFGGHRFHGEDHDSDYEDGDSEVEANATGGSPILNQSI